MRTLIKAIASLLDDSSKASLKRIAWAYGCAKRHSDEESALRRIPIERVLIMREEAR